MDPQPPSSVAVVKTIRDFAAQKLQQEYPYLKTALLHKMLDKVTSSLQDDLAKAEPAIAECKARINFFSLPPEIRDCIYEIALHIEPGYRGYSEGAKINIAKRHWIGCQKGQKNTLSLVSRQIRSEVRAVYFGRNRFRIFVHNWKFLYKKPARVNLFLDRLVRPRGYLFKKVVVRFEDIDHDQLAREIWWHLVVKGYIDCNRYEPVDPPRLNKEMILLIFPLEYAGVHRSAIAIECQGNGPKSYNELPEAKDGWNIFEEVVQLKKGVSEDPLRPILLRRMTF